MATGKTDPSLTMKDEKDWVPIKEFGPLIPKDVLDVGEGIRTSDA